MLKIVNIFKNINNSNMLYGIISFRLKDVFNMYILAKSVLALMIGFVAAIIIGLIIVPLFRRKKNEQVTSVFVKQHKEKNGTPTMGGLIFTISTIFAILLLLFLNKMSISANLIIILFTFFGYGLIGFIDDYMKIKYHSNEKGLSRLQKLIGQIILAIIFFYIYIKDGSTPNIEISALNIDVNLGFVYGFFILFMMVGTSNAVNLTDGLDGLSGGLSAICFLVYGLIAWNSSWLSGYDDIAVFCFVLVGGLLGFLVFNSHPAKIFMGDTGSLALGGTLAAVAILTRRELLLAIVGGVFVIETLTVILQILSVKIRGKKLFPMTPIHHTFEKLGWSESDIVRLFYVIGFILGAGAIVYGVWI